MSRLALITLLSLAIACGGDDDDGPSDPGADAGADTGAPVDWSCSIDQPFPYPVGNPYATNHVDPANSNFVPCDGPTTFELDYHVLQGYGIIQPNTYSPDGTATYVTTLPDDD